MRFLTRFAIVFLILFALIYGASYNYKGMDMFNHAIWWVAPIFSAFIALLTSLPLLFKKHREKYTIKKSVKWILIILGGLYLLVLLGVWVGTFDQRENINMVLISYVILMAAIFIFGRWLRRRIARKRREAAMASLSTDHGSSAWSTYEEFVAFNNPQNVQEGLWIGAGFFRPKSGHLFTVAPPGVGKGTCLIIPNLLVKPCGSYVVIDPKGENACITVRAQKSWEQRVFILDPWNEQGAIGAKHGETSSGFNPLDFLKMNMDELPDNCEMIAYYLIPVSKAHEQFWEERARSFIKNVLIHIITSMPDDQHNFWTLYKLVRNDNDSLAELLVNMTTNTAYDGMVQAFAREVQGLFAAQETYAGIMSNVHNGTKLFESTQLRKSLVKSDFNPLLLPDGNVTVYIVIPERYMQSHSGWLRMVIGLCLKAVNAKPNKRVNFLLDEFAVVGKLDDVQRSYAYGRGQNIVMWSFMQNLAQLKELYGDAGMNVFISNTALFQAFGLRDNFSKEYVSKMLGEATIVKTTVNDSGDSYSSAGRRLLTPEEVGKEPSIICIGDGIKYRIDRTPYYDKGNEWGKFFDEMADAPPRIH